MYPVKIRIELICLLWIGVLVFPCSKNLLAQETGVTITVLDSVSGKNLPDVFFYAQKLSGDRKIIQGFTNETGVFFLPGDAKWQLNLVLIGYSTFSTSIETRKDISIWLIPLRVNLQDVVITGQITPTSTDKSLYSVKVIGSDEIQQSGAGNLRDLMEQQMNARISEDMVLGSSVSINGLGGQHVKILIDGVPVIGRENGNIDISMVNLNNIEQVELVEGPMSVSYGSDASGGTINLITKKKSTYPAEGYSRFTYESIGTFNGEAGASTRFGKNNLNFSGGRNFFDGFSSPDTQRTQQWKPREQIFGNFSWALNYQRNSFRLKTDFFRNLTQDKGTPVINPYEAYAFDQYFTTHRFNNSFSYTHHFTNNGTLNCTGAYSIYERAKNTFRKNLVTLENQLLTAAGTFDTTTFNSSLMRLDYSGANPARKIHLQVGLDVNLDNGTGVKLENGKQSIQDYAGFASAEYHPQKRFFIRPGIRFAYNTRYGAPLIPSLHLKYDITPNNTLRLSVARGYRAPSLKELDLHFVDANHNIRGNENLNAESSFNLMGEFTFHRTMDQYFFELKAGSFFNRINHIITLGLVDASTQLYSYINIDEYKTIGADFNFSVRTNELRASAGLSFTGTSNSLSATSNVSPFNFYPEFVISSGYRFQKWKAGANLIFKNTGTTPGFAVDASGNVYETLVSSFNTLDILFDKNLFREHLLFSFGGKNLFNVVNVNSTAVSDLPHNSEENYVPFSMGRYVYMRVTLKMFNAKKKS